MYATRNCYVCHQSIYSSQENSHDQRGYFHNICMVGSIQSRLRHSVNLDNLVSSPLQERFNRQSNINTHTLRSRFYRFADRTRQIFSRHDPYRGNHATARVGNTRQANRHLQRTDNFEDDLNPQGFYSVNRTQQSRNELAEMTRRQQRLYADLPSPPPPTPLEAPQVDASQQTMVPHSTS